LPRYLVAEEGLFSKKTWLGEWLTLLLQASELLGPGHEVGDLVACQLWAWEEKFIKY